MTVTVESFRGHYPEFNDSTMYTEPSIAYQLAIAYQMLNPNRWSTMLDTGIELYVAHFVQLEAAALAESEGGNIPGQMRGPIQSERVDKLGASYTADGFEVGAGQWNLTIYGTRFYRLMSMFGAGGAQV